jgi:hypothetical protein
VSWPRLNGAWFPSRIVKLNTEPGGALLVVLEDQSLLKFDSWDDMAAFRDAFHAEQLAQDKKYLATVAAERMAKASRKVSKSRKRNKLPHA